MSRKCLAAVAAFCAFATPEVLAQQVAPTEAGRAPARAPVPKTSPQWPLVLPEKLPAPAAAPASQTWTQQDIELAQARCTALLKGLPIVTTPEAPLREGSECGTPAPVKLVSMGKSPQVALSPPPTVTCEMAAMLYRWLERDVQPLARKHLGAPVTRIDTMSSYSC